MNHRLLEDGTLTSPRGFSAGAVFVDIKAAKKKPFDVALLYSEAPCTAAGVFTRNKVKAAPVVLCQERLKSHRAQAIVANSGCANACTGGQGRDNAEQTAVLAARKLGLAPEAVLVASTGVIGTHLPMEKIARGIAAIALSPNGGHDFARAIMTTDTVPKEIAVALDIGGKTVTIGGAAKGAGMIHPDMATMLGFITTDAAVEPAFLQAALRSAVNSSFNMISVDGDTSTNDTVLLLANGLAGNPPLSNGSSAAADFEQALGQVCLHLAKSIARDGEGSTKLIEVTVEGALSIADARTAARAIVSSPLVKTAVYGADPNWGRVVVAAGRSGAELVESKVDLYLDDLCLMREGTPQPFDAGRARKLMEAKEITFRLCLNLGEGRATAWGCDLTEQYIALNGDYTT